MSTPAKVVESLSSTPIVPKEKLKRYTELNKEIKTRENEKEILNKEIKLLLGKQLLEDIGCALEYNQDLVEQYDKICENSEAKPEELAAALVALEDVGITEQMLKDFKSRSIGDVLSHEKVELDIEGFKVRTSIQDRSVINELRAVEYLKSIGRKDLLMTKLVVNEAAMELAAANHEVDIRAFKTAAIDEKLVVALTIKE